MTTTKILIILVLVPAAVADNLLTNPGFEYGNTAGWTDWGYDLMVSTSQVHSGSYSGFAYNRTESWQGPVQSLLGDMENGKTYRISGWVRLQNASSDDVGLTVRQIDTSGTQYHPMLWSTGYDDQWVQLYGFFTLGVSGTLSALDVYFEGPAAGVNFYLDDAAVEEFGSDWETEANDRIEQIRKRDTQITVLSATGQGLSDVDIQIRQIKHRFAFGSAISQYQMDNTDYLDFFKDHFEWAVMENASKWYSNEQTQGDVTYTNADIIYNWCQTNGIIMRGHCIYWCVDQFVQSWIKALDTAGLQAAVESRMDSAVNHFKGKFVHWDINNEMLHGSYFQDRLGASIRPWMFQAAHAIDPNCLLFVNDYSVVSGSETDAYKAQIQGLINDGVPVHGIGAQCHMWGSVEPLTVYSRLDSLAELGLPIWCSEYDFASADEGIRAEGLEMFYRTAFSHSAVEGILMWGFWENSHWRDNCHIVNSDWSLNQAGIRYEALMDEWTTDVNCITDPNGQVNFRGFHGTYEITVTPADAAPTVRTIELEPGPDTAQFIFSITYPGDFEPDGDVDFEDFCVLAQSWKSKPGQPHWNPDCDISDPNDETIDEYDLAVFTDYWLMGK